MKVRAYFKRILSRDKIVVGGAVTLRTVLCGLFIALIALFRTSPVGGAKGDQPVPLPAELGIEDVAPGAPGAGYRPFTFDAARGDLLVPASIHAEAAGQR